MQANAASEAVQDIEDTLHSEKQSMLKQPKAVWAVAFASVFAFMGIGLVDPILPAIAGAVWNISIAFSGVSILIVVGVALETMKQIESQLTMRNYEGILT